MDASTVLLTGLDSFTAIVEGVPADAWDRPSPCEGWTVRHVVGHVLQVTDATRTLLGGEDYDWSGAGEPADRAAGDAVAAFNTNAAAVRDALGTADLSQEMTTPMGPMKLVDRLAFPAFDLHVHGWDVAHATGQSADLPADIIAFAQAAMEPVPAEMMRGGGVFGPEVPAPEGATPTEAFLAWTGRQPS